MTWISRRRGCVSTMSCKKSQRARRHDPDEVGVGRHLVTKPGQQLLGVPRFSWCKAQVVDQNDEYSLACASNGSCAGRSRLSDLDLLARVRMRPRTCLDHNRLRR